jgi:hypothetical protein
MLAYGNSAQPPALLIIMNNAPEDVNIHVITDDGYIEVSKASVAWETYFVFYDMKLGASNEVKLKIYGNGNEYEQILDSKYLNTYDNIITYDFNTRNISVGKLLLRSIILVGLRVTLTLIIESIVFFLFGFREKRSWIVFLIMNLITQGWLNITLNGSLPIRNYAVFSLIFMEIFIFIVEIITVLAAIKEHGKIRQSLYVFIANLLSLILGSILITSLPI